MWRDRFILPPPAPPAPSTYGGFVWARFVRDGKTTPHEQNTLLVAEPNSLQFDPAPRAGEPMVSRRVPDYFLVSDVALNLSLFFTFQRGEC